MTDLQIQYFLKVAQHLSYTAAARELFVSQPSLSKQVAALERELGVALFDRSRRNRIALTPAGHLFQQSFQKSVQNFQDTLERCVWGRRIRLWSYGWGWLLGGTGEA